MASISNRMHRSVDVTSAASMPRISQISAELMKLSKSKSKGVSMTGGVVSQSEQCQNEFPPNLLMFAKIIPGNNVCPDCSLRHNQAPNTGLSYAK